MNLTKGNNSIPGWLITANQWGLYLGVVVGFLAVGFAIHAGRLRSHAGLIAALSGVKFIVSPVIGLALALAFGLDGRTLAVIAIESACPVAISAVMTSAIYDLDKELAGGALIVTTALATVAVFIGLAVL